MHGDGSGKHSLWTVDSFMKDNEKKSGIEKRIRRVSMVYYSLYVLHP